jgi:hypothetical protein
MFQEQSPSDNQQVIDSLQYAHNSLVQNLVNVKTEGAIIDAKMLTIFLLLVTIVRFFVRRRRLARIRASS